MEIFTSKAKLRRFRKRKREEDIILRKSTCEIFQITKRIKSDESSDQIDSTESNKMEIDTDVLDTNLKVFSHDEDINDDLYNFETFRFDLSKSLHQKMQLTFARQTIEKVIRAEYKRVSDKEVKQKWEESAHNESLVHRELSETFIDTSTWTKKWIDHQICNITQIKRLYETNLQEQLNKLWKLELRYITFKPEIERLEKIHKDMTENMEEELQRLNIAMEEVNISWTKLRTQIHREINAIEKKMAGDFTNVDLSSFFNQYDEGSNNCISKENFRSCLVSLGFRLPQDVRGDEEFQIILRQVDPYFTGFVPFGAFMAYFSCDETDSDSEEHLAQSLQTLASQKNYITEDEIKREFKEEEAKFLVNFMEEYNCEFDDVKRAFSVSDFSKKFKDR